MPPIVRRNRERNPFLSQRYRGGHIEYYAPPAHKKMEARMEHSEPIGSSFYSRPVHAAFDISPQKKYEPPFSDARDVGRHKLSTGTIRNRAFPPFSIASTVPRETAFVRANQVASYGPTSHVFGYGFGIFFAFLIIVTIADWAIQHTRSDFTKESKISF